MLSRCSTRDQRVAYWSDVPQPVSDPWEGRDVLLRPLGLDCLQEEIERNQADIEDPFALDVT